MKRKTTIIVTIFIMVLSALGGILNNIATSTALPPIIIPYLGFAWPAFFIVTVLGIVLVVWQTLQEKHTDRSAPTQQKLYRQRMLERVQTMWINGVLEQSLHGAALIALGLKERQDVVAVTWRLAFQESDQPKRDLPTGTHITDVYNSEGGELLILGEPGSGKTTLLLELTRDLLKRADDDEDYPIPVVFNLSSWAVKKPPLTEWLIEELCTTYRVPQPIGQSWVESDQILPLIDGLDEVAQEARAACIDAINAYRKEHGLLPTVVCSRSTEYNDLIETKHKLQLHSAVVVQPLTEQQIDDYLSSAGGQSAAMRMVLHEDRALQELATTPLILNILTLISQEGSVAKLGSTRQILATYVERMVNSKGNVRQYPLNQTLARLGWLARHMRAHSQTIFYLGNLQPDWLPEGQEVVYMRNKGLFGALIGALISALVGILVSGFVGLAVPVSILVLGLAGMLGGALVGLSGEEEGDTCVWLLYCLVGTLVCVLVGALAGALGRGPVSALSGELKIYSHGLGGALVSAVTFGLFGGAICMLLGWILIRPIGAFPSGLVGALVGALGFIFGGAQISAPGGALGGGVIVGALVGMLGYMFGSGLADVFQHDILRFCLWQTGTFPWKVGPFLEDATARMLLQRVGGSYSFIHHLLLDYFADLEKDDA